MLACDRSLRKAKGKSFFTHEPTMGDLSVFCIGSNSKKVVNAANEQMHALFMIAYYDVVKSI